MHKSDRKFYKLFIYFVPFRQTESNWKSEEFRVWKKPTEKTVGFYMLKKSV